MRNYLDYKEQSNRIKIALQVCHEGVSKGKFLEQEYKLFYNLAELYLLKGDKTGYPKVIAIYQYLHKLVDKAFKETDNQEKHNELDRNIGLVEVEYIEKVTGKSVKKDYGIKSVEKVREYRKRLEEYRETVKNKLKEIENLGIIEGQEELNEEGLKERANKVENIYKDIRGYFIGKRNKAGKLIKKGLINKLLIDCIEELGWLPFVGKGENRRFCKYSIFGMGSMALGTMTPWSDIEFGILIEDGLSETEEKNVKEYFRKLTTLLHIKIVNFGETPLRMMGIEELNNFKTGHSKDDWFYDDYIYSGFSFDGPHWHACKTPLGRVARYHKTLPEDTKLIPCAPYELIMTVSQSKGFFENRSWHKNDPQLVQSLSHVCLLHGSLSLIRIYKNAIKTFMEEISIDAFEILQSDSKELNPSKQVFDQEKEGKILNVKKEIYRFPDRLIVAFADCLGSQGKTSWKLIQNLKIAHEGANNLQIALSIATEMRLRTYSYNNAQKEDLTALALYESKIEVLKKENLAEQVFHLKDIRILYRYYYTVMSLAFIISNVHLLIDLKTRSANASFYIAEPIIRGFISKRFLRYYDAIEDFEKITSNPDIKQTLANLYYIVGRNKEALLIFEELLSIAYKDNNRTHIVSYLNMMGMVCNQLGMFYKALVYHQESLEIAKMLYGNNHSEIAKSENNLGVTLDKLGRFNDALTHKKEALRIRLAIYKGDHEEIVSSLNSIGDTYDSLGKYEKALKCHKKSLDMTLRIYKGSHPNVVQSLNKLVIVYENLAKYDVALKIQEESLDIMYKVYKGNHTDIAASLNNVGTILESLGRFQEAQSKYRESLEMQQRLYEGNHTNTAMSLSNLANCFASLGQYKKALAKYKECLRIQRSIYEGIHPDIAATFNVIGDTYENLGRYKKALEAQEKGLEMRKKIYGDNHFLVARSLNDKGTALYSMGKREDALKVQEEGLRMKRTLFKGDHVEIAASLNDLSNTLLSLGRTEEARSKLEESLKMKKNIFGEEHISIATSLVNMGIIFTQLKRYNEALEITLQAQQMLNRLLPGKHPYLKTAKSQIVKYTLFLANEQMLAGNTDEAWDYYPTLGIKSQKKLPKVLTNYAYQYYEDEELDLSISCYEVLYHKLTPLDPEVKQNLACLYHVMAHAEISKNDEKVKEYIKKAKIIFEEAVTGESEKKASLYVEYAMFLFKYHKVEDIKEYKKIKRLLNKSKKEDDSVLVYGRIEKNTIIPQLQELLNVSDNGEIELKPKVLATYLLIKIYLIHNQKRKAQKVFKELQSMVSQIGEDEDPKLIEYLCNDCSKGLEAIENLKLQEDKKQKALIEFNSLLSVVEPIPLETESTTQLTNVYNAALTSVGMNIVPSSIISTMQANEDIKSVATSTRFVKTVNKEINVGQSK